MVLNKKKLFEFLPKFKECIAQKLLSQILLFTRFYKKKSVPVS